MGTVLVDEDWLAALQAEVGRLAQKVDNFNGPGVYNDSHSMSLFPLELTPFAPPDFTRRSFWGRVVQRGPNGEPDPAKPYPVYWVQGSRTAVGLNAPNDEPNYYNRALQFDTVTPPFFTDTVVPVFNWGEVWPAVGTGGTEVAPYAVQSTKVLRPGRWIRCFAEQDANGTTTYVAHERPPVLLPVTVTSAGSGTYNVTDTFGYAVGSGPMSPVIPATVSGVTNAGPVGGLAALSFTLAPQPDYILWMVGFNFSTATCT